MDNKCYDVLSDLHQEYHIPIRLSDFEEGDKELLTAKLNRSFGEYCWTCAPSIILYILNRFNEKCCTYIDADMYFYSDPQILVNEMLAAGKSVMITPHRFSIDNMRLVRYGIYCVEFNTFVNESKSLDVLRKWKQDCLDCCTSIYDGVHYGDQKYLDAWPECYPKVVHVCQNPGAGLAPWNIEWYQAKDLNKHIVFFKRDNVEIPIVFYHFQHVTYMTRSHIRTGIEAKKNNVDYGLVDFLYTEYLNKIEVKKKFLESRYNVDYLMQEHPVQNSAPKTLKSRLREVRFIYKIYRFIFLKKNKMQHEIFLH